jgi:uncharacterized protein (DUF1015 family)
MRTYEMISLGIPKILLPKKGTDLTKWAVIACDQFTSEPDYWRMVSILVGQAPSALNLIFPEVYLGEKNPESRIARIREHMARYIDQGLFEETEGFIYVERKVGDKTRKGLVVCLDLEHYDFGKGSTSLIRATEGTILERIPPRVKIREGAPIELPHIMVLIDDPDNTVIGPLTQNKDQLEKLYDFELMMGSGHLTGYRIKGQTHETGVINSLKTLAYSANFSKRYGVKAGTPILLFAMGDGNHSLATAKTIWEKTKENAPDKTMIMNSPLRYALVELVNLHDDALIFEPIHRVLFEVAAGKDVVQEMYAYFKGRCAYTALAGFDEMKAEVDEQKDGSHKIGTITVAGFGIVEVKQPESNLPVGTLQPFLDAFMKNKGAKEIDYVHGTEPVSQLGKKPGNMGLYLPAMRKTDLFKTVILDGVLPRKTFSMGEAWEKRFYMEARKLF